MQEINRLAPNIIRYFPAGNEEICYTLRTALLLTKLITLTYTTSSVVVVVAELLILFIKLLVSKTIL